VIEIASAAGGDESHAPSSRQLLESDAPGGCPPGVKRAA